MELSDFKYLLWDNTRRINDAVNNILNTYASSYGLSGMQLRILMEVEQNGPHTVGSLANNVLIAGTNISTMCKKLESLGMLTRVRVQKDERMVRIELTEKGKRIMKEINEYYERSLVKAMGNDLGENLEIIIIAMEKINELFVKLNEQGES